MIVAAVAAKMNWKNQWADETGESPTPAHWVYPMNELPGLYDRL